ncbi:MAG: NUDIX hydrolase [Proteobacteria bacterium]|nr:NUDIX hydrolase [Pseudomonadota bacterium]
MTSDNSSGAAPTGPTVLKVPEGDTHERLVCETCGFIDYKNPVVVVGSVCVWRDKILLCRRAIDPRRGYWTIPAGYLELDESTSQGAQREALEEAGAEIEIEALLAVYNIPRISQVQVIYAARLDTPDIAPGIESLEARLVDWADIPWHDIAFPSVHWALHDHRAYSSGAPYTVRENPDTPPPTGTP